jgi:hypothetical protein
MSPAEIIERSNEEGVQLTLSPSGSISAKGNPSAIDRWLLKIKHNKAAIITELQLEHRRAKVREMLRDNPGISYAIEVADANTDPVIVRRYTKCHYLRDEHPAGVLRRLFANGSDW